MAHQIAAATGNFTTLATWLVADATSLLDSIANNTAVTTSYATSRSSVFQPGAITIDGIAVKIASRVASPVGTFRVQLYNSTLAAAVAGTEVIINVSDIHVGDTAARGGCGWFFFKFAAPVLLVITTDYAVQAQCSTASEVSLFRDATATNWSRMLRTTTAPASLAAADNFIIMGEWTAAATVNALTVTNDNTATTAWGYIQVGKSGTWTNGTAGSTAYYTKTGGDFIVSGGTVNFGSSGARLVDTSSFTLMLNSGSAAQYGLRILNGSTMNGGGAAKLSWTYLNTDEAASATVIGLVDTTGWKVSDVLCFASTTTTASQHEKKTILTVDSATQVTLTAGLTNAHSGTNSGIYDTRAEVGNLTRNVLITGASAANSGYIYIGATAVVNFYDVEFTMLGALVTDKRGINIGSTTGTFVFDNCSVHDFTVSTTNGFYIEGAITTSGSNILNNCVVYNTVYRSIQIPGAISGNITISGCLVMACGDISIQSADAGCIITNTTVASGGDGFAIAEGAAMTGTFTGNLAHSGSGNGFVFGNLTSSSGWSFRAYRNVTGFRSELTGGNHSGTITTFGNSTVGINLALSFVGNMRLTYTANAGITNTQPTGIVFSPIYILGLTFENSVFGTTTAHTTNDISNASNFVYCWLKNTSLASTTEVAGQTTFSDLPLQPFGIFSDKHDQTAGSYKSFYKYGTITSDTVIYNTASPSERIAPNNASNKIISGSKFIAVNSGSTVDVAVYTRKSAAGDGTAYNGNQPRLIVRANPAIGISADTVLDTHSAAAGSWEQLTGTTAAVTGDGVVEIFVDCDGTTGWINTDDWTTSTNNNPSGLKYWNNGIPSITGEYNASGGGSFTGFMLQ